VVERLFGEARRYNEKANVIVRTYAEHDRIEMVAGREDAQAQSIKAWKDLRQTHGDDVIVVTRRNRDAVSLNLAAREVLREEGLIEGKDVSLTAVDRDGGLAQLPLARGDRIRFGETLHQHRIRNGTRGKVERYAQGVDGSVRVTIRLEDGRVIEDAWSGFAQQWRCRHAGVPKIVHVGLFVLLDPVDDLATGRIGHRRNVLAHFIDVLAVACERGRGFILQGKGFFDLGVDHLLEIGPIGEFEISHGKSKLKYLPISAFPCA
jgi:hypothetical protein